MSSGSLPKSTPPITGPSLTPDLEAALLHLSMLTGAEDLPVSWQVFADADKERPDLARSYFGTLDKLEPTLRKAQQQGCGVFVAVNETDGEGRRTENITACRAVFLDLDGAPLPDSWPVEPDLIVQSSNGEIEKYQVWWRIKSTADFAGWKSLQKFIAAKFRGDPKCTHVTQVGRCAGFWHQKDPENPWQVCIIKQGGEAPTSLDVFAQRFGFVLDRESNQVDVNVDNLKAPVHGWDDPADVERARDFLSRESNWRDTSNGEVSVYGAAAKLRDLGISPDLAVELIEEHLPIAPPETWQVNHVAEKVAHAYRYSKQEPGARSVTRAAEPFLSDPLNDDEIARQAPETGSTKTGISFTPYVRKDPKGLPSRDYLMKPTFIRQFTTGTLAHGAVGKSITLMTEAICLASGEPLLGSRPHGRYRVVYWNGEDPREELDRRIAAICKHYDLPPEATDDHLFVDSGRDLPIDIVSLDPKTRLACPKDKDAIISALKAARIDVLIVDPFVSTHSVPENDNGMIEAVAQAWNDVAERAGVAVHVSHHAVKARGRVVEAMDYRGGGAALAKLRYLRVFNRMSAKEAEQAGLPTEKANLHFKIDDREKSNLLPPSEDTNWFELVTVDLENADFERDGLYAESDRIGVPTAWQFPDYSVSEPTLSDIKQLFALMGKKVWRKTSTAKEDWVGLVVAEALELDLEIDEHRKAVQRFIKEWAESGVLDVSKPARPDKNGNRREGYVAGTMPSDW